jgi:Fimbrial assembly protein (PilN)
MITFLSKIVKLNNIHIVGVISNDNEENYNVLTVKKKGNKIDIVTAVSFNTFGEFKKTMDPKLPIIIVVDGKGVLNKEIDFSNEADVNWQKNIDFTAIYHTSLKGFSSNFISFCRKNGVEETITKFQKNGFQIVDIYIGSFLSGLLYNTIKKETISSNELLLNFENGKLVKFTKQTEPIKKEQYNIGKETVSSVFLPLYGALIHFFLQPKEVSKTKNDTLNEDEIIYKKAFNLLGATMLVGFFSALLTSYLLIQYYGSKNGELNLQNVYSNQSYQIILDLEKQKENKQKILKESGFLSSKFISYYSFEIIKSVPQDIALNELNIKPLSKETKANLKMDFDVKTILIEGETSNESSLNSWMEELKKMNWVKNFEIISLKKDKKNKSQFELKITIEDV